MSNHKHGVWTPPVEPPTVSNAATWIVLINLTAFFTGLILFLKMTGIV